MKEVNNGEKNVIQFNSINEFYKYLCDTPINEAFRWAEHQSVSNSFEFSRTYSFEQAVDMMKNGWESKAKELNLKLKEKMRNTAYVNERKQCAGVAGFQPIVARYLSGDPISMVTTKTVKQKQKVINIVKSINYSAGCPASLIEKESLKALQLVQKLEANGYRVNLDIALGSAAGENRGKNQVELYTRVRIKKASEKLNISKMVFAMVHPSMLRRLFFRFIEVYPKVTDDFVGGYGAPIDFSKMKEVFDDAIIIPASPITNLEDINSIEELKAIV